MERSSGSQDLICPLSQAEEGSNFCSQDRCRPSNAKIEGCLYLSALKKFGFEPKGRDSPDSLLSQGYNFRAIYQKHYGRVYSLNYNILKNKEDAEDLTQETFIRAYNNLTKIDPHVPIFAWLCRVATNLCIDRLRKTKDLTFMHLDTCITSYVLERQIANFIDAMDIGRELEMKENFKLVNQALEELSPNYYRVLMLRICEGLNSKEVAKILNKTVSGVDTLLFHAKKKFKSLYKQLVE